MQLSTETLAPRVVRAYSMPSRLAARRIRALGLGAGLGGVAHAAPAALGTPLTIFGAGAVLQWVRADKGITLGTGVSAWTDQSSGGCNYAQATGSLQPAYIATDATLNNLPTIAFDGTNDNLQCSTLTLPSSGTTPTCVLLIAKFNMYTGQGVAVGQPANTGNQCVITTTGASALTVANPSGVNNSYATSAWERVRADFSNSVGDLFRVGPNGVTGNAGNQASTAGRCIGGFSAPSFTANMTAFEVIYLNIIPSIGQMSGYDAYITRVTGGAVAV